MTRISVVAGTQSAAQDERRRSYDLLLRAYWMPVRSYIRLRWRKEETAADDLTQEFFARVLEKGFLRSYDPSKGRFRTFLRICLDRFVANETAAAGRIKRGGTAAHVRIDPAALPEDLLASEDPDEILEREWIASFFALALERLASECERAGKRLHYAIFERYDLCDADERYRLTYDLLAAELGLKATDVTNYLAWTRRRFRALSLDLLRELTSSDQELREEARTVLGVTLP